MTKLLFVVGFLIGLTAGAMVTVATNPTLAIACTNANC
jgi:hypothetical protein